MSLPPSDLSGDALPRGLERLIGESHLFRVTIALSSAGIMKHDIICELDGIDDLPENERDAAFEEFMAGVSEKISKHSSSSSEEEEVYI